MEHLNKLNLEFEKIDKKPVVKSKSWDQAYKDRDKKVYGGEYYDKEGTGKYKGKLGAFKCELVKDTSIKFDTAGMNDIIRNNYETTHPIGTIITFVHMGFTKSGAPRHPNYLRKRTTE